MGGEEGISSGPDALKGFNVKYFAFLKILHTLHAKQKIFSHSAI